MGGMMRLLLLLWAGVTVSTAVDLYKRIVNGGECDNNQRHFHVKLSLAGGLICGGSLIKDRWVLTAKHCKDNAMTALVGVHPRPGKKIPPIKVKRQVEFGKYDLLLVELTGAVKSQDVRPVALPTRNDCNTRPRIGATVQIAGYGPTAADSTALSQTLQCANTKIAKCDLLENPDREFCYDRNIAHPMGGDSGGGVVSNNKLYGVISDEISYLDVCEFLTEINDAMNTQQKSKKCMGGKCTLI